MQSPDGLTRKQRAALRMQLTQLQLQNQARVGGGNMAA